MKVRGVELYVSISGQGAPLVWAHGLTDSMAHEDRPGSALATLRGPADGVQWVRYDARGHGQSGGAPVPGDYTWASLAQDMLALAAALRLESFAAGGASMGCGTALHAALQAPQRVQALVLVVPPTAWETRTARAAYWEQAATRVEAGGVEAYVAAARQLPPQPAWWWQGREQEREDDLQDLRQRLDARLLPAILRGAALANLPPRDELRALRMPALLLAWEGDPAHPVSTAEDLHALLPQSQLSVAKTRAEVAQWGAQVRRFLS